MLISTYSPISVSQSATASRPDRSCVTHRRRRRRSLEIVSLSVASLLLVAAESTRVNADTDRVELVNDFSGLRADVIAASSNAYQGVFLWPDNDSASQEFDLLDSGNGYFRIRARHSGQCLMLDWRSGSYSNGTPIIQYPYCDAGYAPAEWRRGSLSGTRCSDGICTTGIDQTVLINRRTGRCLDVGNANGGRPPAQAILQQWDCATSTDDWNMGNQAWDILPPGWHRID
jgi:hypothetical protein